MFELTEENAPYKGIAFELPTKDAPPENPTQEDIMAFIKTNIPDYDENIWKVCKVNNKWVLDNNDKPTGRSFVDVMFERIGAITA